MGHCDVGERTENERQRCEGESDDGQVLEMPSVGVISVQRTNVGCCAREAEGAGLHGIGKVDEAGRRE